MNLSLFIFISLALQLVSFLAARFATPANDKADYFLAGRGVSFFPLFMTFLATQIGGGMILGCAEEAYASGWQIIAYPIGQALGFLALSAGVGKRMASFQVSTIAALVGEIYRSPLLKKITSLFSILSLSMLFIAQIIASKKFMLSLGLSSTALFLLFWAIVIAYTTMGGFKAVVITDVVQALFFILTFAFTAFYVLIWQGTPEPLESTLVLPSLPLNPSMMWSWLIMPLLFMMIEQDMAQRCFAANSSKTVSKATLAAAISTVLIALIPIYFGLLGKALNMATSGSVFLNVVQALTGPNLSALIAAAVLAAIISTADSLINAIVSNIATDFNADRSIRQSQAITLGIAALGIGSSFYLDNVISLLMQSYELSISCITIPVIMGLMRQKGCKEAAFAAIAIGFCSFFALQFWQTTWPKEMLSLSLSLTGYLAAEVFFKKTFAIS
ncbi:MAG: panF [Chlamydiales bacterium]|jgi:SSS family solute:Na+ symporter|nr:panF [Chlamydiales bacterium]